MMRLVTPKIRADGEPKRTSGRQALSESVQAGVLRGPYALLAPDRFTFECLVSSTPTVLGVGGRSREDDNLCEVAFLLVDTCCDTGS